MTMKTAVPWMTCLILSLAAPVAVAQPSVEHYSSNPDMQLPFSDAVRVGDMLYLSGKIGNRPGTRQLAAGGIAGETRQAMENIKASLEKYGSSLGEVVKCTVFLADIGEWEAMNAVYVTYFPVNPPARSALGASGLALGARVEIECLAALR
ncbi:MAG: RidA family protein [Xanthomonadales bacterium]|nr:RidA family protein [Xanthomonadales bacterium]